ncbi:MAG TPA: hypothetical protein VMD79_11635 [Solirubrobacteraceae bacterium]|nr:hypothetical protein [Solirubrobacteraceae bacterium]
MRITSRIAVVTAIATLALIDVGATASAAHVAGDPKCPPAHLLRRITADKQAIVYEAHGPKEKGDEGEEEEEGRLMIWACAYRHRRYILGHIPEYGPEGGEGIELETLAGTMVAYEKSLVEGFPTPGLVKLEIIVRNLVTGRVVHSVPNAEAIYPEDIGRGDTEKIVVKRDGAVAWTVQPGVQPAVIQVWADDSLGRRLLASSTDIAPRSLQLTGSTLKWLEDGKPTYAILH